MKKITILILTIMSLILISCHSPKKIFEDEVAAFKPEVKPAAVLITGERIAHLPGPVQRYIHLCGFVGKPTTSHAEIVWQESHIRLKPGQKWMKLKTWQHNFVDEPARLAYMRARMFGFIPFEGRDKYHNGGGHMYGTLGRMIKVFNETDIEIARGAAMVILAEALFVPSYAIQPYIHWEAVDDLTAKARFVHKGIDVGGTFHFNDQGEYVSFTTNERPYSSPGGGFEQHPYTIKILNYKQQGDIRIATEVSATWNLPEGDFEYWKGTVREIIY